MSTEISVNKPTRLLVEKNEKGEMTKGRIEEVTLAYVKLQEGELAFGSDSERDYAVTAVVTEATAKDFKSVFVKNGFRTIPTEEFEGKMRMKAPYPEQKDQYCIKLKSNTAYSADIPNSSITAGMPVPYESPSRPKLFEIVNGKPVDITMTTKVANGSKGVVAFKVSINKFGTFPLLSGVMVTDLIEYADGNNFAADFGDTATTTTRKALPAPEANSPQANDSANSEADWF